MSEYVDGAAGETLGPDAHTAIVFTSIAPTGATAGNTGAITIVGTGLEEGLTATVSGSGVTFTIGGVNAGGTGATGTYDIDADAATGARVVTLENLTYNEATGAFTVIAIPE
jgi:hypothetical protein